MMPATNDELRKVLFAGFGGFQDKLVAMVAEYRATTSQQDRSKITTRFVKGVVIPYLESTRESIVNQYEPAMRALEADVTRLLAACAGVKD